MATRRNALLFVCPWLTDADADAVLAGEDDQGPTMVERLAHAETEHREWMHLAMDLWRGATGSEAPWPGAAKALADVRAARAAPSARETKEARCRCGCGRTLVDSDGGFGFARPCVPVCVCGHSMDEHDGGGPDDPHHPTCEHPRCKCDGWTPAPSAAPARETPPDPELCACGHARGAHGPVYSNNVIRYRASCWTLLAGEAVYCGCNHYAPAPPSDAGTEKGGGR
jgi:hypothetical protein